MENVYCGEADLQYYGCKGKFKGVDKPDNGNSALATNVSWVSDGVADYLAPDEIPYAYSSQSRPKAIEHVRNRPRNQNMDDLPPRTSNISKAR